MNRSDDEEEEEVDGKGMSKGFNLDAFTVKKDHFGEDEEEKKDGDGSFEIIDSMSEGGRSQDPAEEDEEEED